MEVAGLVIGAATGVNEVVKLGKEIRDSIQQVNDYSKTVTRSPLQIYDQVKVNRKKLQGLSEDMVRTLYQLQSFYDSHAPEMSASRDLGQAIEQVQRRMFSMNQQCRSLAPASGSSTFSRWFKAYTNRRDIEDELRSLEKEVSNCFLRFTVSLFYQHSVMV
jgi:hypothetical protein